MRYKYLILCLFISFSFQLKAQNSQFIVQETSVIHYKTYGKGKPVVIINGGPGMNCNGFEKVASKIADMGYNAIIYDQRGTGKSIIDSVHEGSITMNAMVQDLETLRKHLGYNEWVILGHSFGGLLATCYAYQYPNHVSKLIFSSSGGINLDFMTYVSGTINHNLSKTASDSLSYYNNLLDNDDTSASTIRNRADIIANAYVYNKKNACIIADRLIEANYEINGLVFKDLKKSGYDFSNKFSDFKQAVLVLQGKNDIIKTETAEKISDAFMNSRLVLLNKCGHYGWMDVPKKYWKAIETFLKSDK
ncbi:MAG: alpha/beta fold hydrolase [Chitinophagales bacterium]|nr:alpha/beta fold hydrolase [Chitinophagales bacterium]